MEVGKPHVQEAASGAIKEAAAQAAIAEKLAPQEGSGKCKSVSSRPKKKRRIAPYEIPDYLYEHGLDL